MTTASRSSREDGVELPGWGPENCVCGLKGHMYEDLDCVKTITRQHRQITIQI